MCPDCTGELAGRGHSRLNINRNGYRHSTAAGVAAGRIPGERSAHRSAGAADDRLRTRASAIESAMQGGKPAAVQYACNDFMAVAADFYRVQRPELRVLSARPLRVREGGWSSELFGDYHPETLVIRVWMRTAVRKQVTSYGTFFSTLCHEFCHHLDCKSFAYVGRRTRAAFISGRRCCITMRAERR